MYLFCPRFAQEIDYLAARRAAHYGVVDEHYPLILTDSLIALSFILT